jgi:peptidoglycan-N-acetylglucosamine deacetylase
MRKRRVIVIYAVCALAGAGLVALVDAGLLAAHHRATPWLIDVCYASVVVVATVGCFAPNAPIFGRVVDGSGVFAPVIALTFDDGPSPDTTPPILEALRSFGMRATFFVLGKHAARYPHLIEQIVRDGHEVASHGYTHGLLVLSSPGEITAELVRTKRVLEEAGAPPPRLFRTPHGFKNPFVVPVAQRLGYRVVGWTKGVFDTAKPGADVIARRAIKALRPGAILLLHDADGNDGDDRFQTAEALPGILEAVQAHGYQAVTVSELAALAPQRRTSFGRLALVVAGVAGVVTLIVERIDRSQVADAWAIFRTLSLPFVVAALFANLLSVFFKAVVWKASLDSVPNHPPLRYRQIVPAIFIGFLLNSALVARLGEVGRMFVLRRRVAKDTGVSIPMTTIAGTVVIEQVVLGVTLVVIVIAITLFLPSVPSQLLDGVIALTVAVVALVVGVIAVEAFTRWRRRSHPERRQEAPAARTWRVFLRNAEALLHGISHGQSLIRDPARAAPAAAGGVLSWSAQVLGIWLTLKAFGIDEHTLGAAAVVFVASNVVGLVQVTPGNVGVFQIAVWLALNATYNVDRVTGITFGIGLQIIEVSLGAGLGLLFLSLEGLSFGEVRRGMTEAVDEEDTTPPPRLVPAYNERRRLVV